MASFAVVFGNMHLANRLFDTLSVRRESADGVRRGPRLLLLTLDGHREAIHFFDRAGSSSALCREWIGKLFPVNTGFAYPLDIVIYSK